MMSAEVEINNQELNIKVALKLMGFRWFNDADSSALLSPDWQKALHLGPEHLTDEPEHERQRAQGLPDFAGDIAAAYQMEERIKELGLERDYANALGILIAESDHQRLYVEPFDLIHASPVDRCRAALKVVS